MSIDHDLSREKSVALSVELWQALSQWWESRGQEEGSKPVTPNVSAQLLVQAVGPVVYNYLTSDSDAAFDTRVQVFRSTIGLFGHDDWASCARKTVEARGGNGKSFGEFRVLSKNTKSTPIKQLFLDLAKMSAELASKQADQTLKSISSWDPAPASVKKQKMS